MASVGNFHFSLNSLALSYETDPVEKMIIMTMLMTTFSSASNFRPPLAPSAIRFL